MSIPQRSCFLCRHDYGSDMGISAFKQINQTAFGPLQSGKECVCMCMWGGLWTGGLLSITQYHFSLSPSCNYTQQLDRLIVLQHLTSKKKKRKSWSRMEEFAILRSFFPNKMGKGKGIGERNYQADSSQNRVQMLGTMMVYDDFSFLDLGESAPLAPTDPFTPLAVIHKNDRCKL